MFVCFRGLPQEQSFCLAVLQSDVHAMFLLSMLGVVLVPAQTHVDILNEDRSVIRRLVD